ncbi:FkbM family methyltransferase, partial [Candidatus Daviesbacteria bacterium]|nr:FkbM family methyltransferase [Candidatus Daviesbacteria bacterium]
NGEFPFGGPSDNRTMRSLHMAIWPNGKNNEVVEAVTFDKLFEDEKIERVHLLKLDVEGSETEILSSDGFKKVAPKIDVIIGETHKWSGRHPNQVKDALKMNGFEVSGMPHDPEIFIARRK